MTPSHVCTPSAAQERTGMVPSPDSILVRSCPRARRFGCLKSTVRTTVVSRKKKQGKLLTKLYLSTASAAASEAERTEEEEEALLLFEVDSCGENILASPHGAVLMYRWKRTLG